MTEKTGNRLLNELKQTIEHDVSGALKSLLEKSRLDLLPRLSEIIESDDVNQINEAKSYIKDAADIIAADLMIQIKQFLQNY